MRMMPLSPYILHRTTNYAHTKMRFGLLVFQGALPMPGQISSRRCKLLSHFCRYLEANLYRYPIAHRARDSLDISRPQPGRFGNDQSLDLFSPEPIHPPHPVLRHDAPSHPNLHGHPEQDPARHDIDHARSDTSDMVYRRPGDQAANSSVRLNYHRGNDIVAGRNPLRPQPGSFGYHHNEPASISHQRDRLGYEADSSVPALPHLRGLVDVSGYPYLDQAPGAPRLQPARLHDVAINHTATSRLIQDTGMTGQANPYLRGDYQDRSQLQVHRGRSTDVLHRKGIHRQDSDDSDDGDAGVSVPAATVRKQHHNELYLPTGYRKMQRINEAIDVTPEERGRSRKRLGNRFDDDLEQSSKGKAPPFETKERGNEHLSQNTTVSYMMNQANDVPQQDPPQLQPALPVHSNMPKTKYRPSPINVDAAERLHKKSQEGQNIEIVHNVVKPKNHRLRLRRRQQKPENHQVKPEHPKVEQDPPRPTSSVYSQKTMDIQDSAKVSPLRINKAFDLPGKDNMIEKYQQSQNKETGGLSKALTMPEIDQIRGVSPYTPLTGWLERDQDPRKGKKAMTGANGWLENAAIEAQVRPEPKRGFFTSVKKRVQDMVSILTHFPWPNLLSS